MPCQNACAAADSTVASGPKDGERRYVDVRTPAEFREVHIPGSTNVPLPDITERAAELQRAAAGGRLVLVCRTGGRARKAKEELLRCGIQDCEVLEGGVAAWEQAGRPVERGRAAISLERQVRIAAGTLVLLGTALGALIHPGLLVVPAFVGAGLVFSGVTDTCGMGMLLARMPWNRGASSPSCTA
jgi:rhodanese-related sulfurtransferase